MYMEKNTAFTLKIKSSELKKIREAAKLAYNPKKHRADYGVSAYLKESALNRADRALKRKAK